MTQAPQIGAHHAQQNRLVIDDQDMSGRRSPIRAVYDRAMKFHTEYLTFQTKKHREYINITPEVEAACARAGSRKG